MMSNPSPARQYADWGHVNISDAREKSWSTTVQSGGTIYF
jgi:hypothetical protein